MIIDGKEYVLKSEMEEMLKGKKVDFQVISKDFWLIEEGSIMAIGSFQLGSDWVTTRISTAYLEKVIKCLKAMSLNKEGIEAIDLAWSKNSPAVIGSRNEKGQMSGFIIAPRIENE